MISIGQDSLDFGTSRSIPIDQTHSTKLVQGTFGFLDPEYFQSSQFTEKNNVYSFGMVLVALLTGPKPILSARLAEEGREVVMELEGIKMPNGALTPVMETHCEEHEYTMDEFSGPWEPASPSTGSFLSGSTIQVSDAKSQLLREVIVVGKLYCSRICEKN